MIKDRFNACYEMIRDLAYVGVKKEWPPKVDDRREIKDGIKNGRAHDILCEVDDELWRLMPKLENFLEAMGYEMPRYMIPDEFKSLVEERDKKGG